MIIRDICDNCGSAFHEGHFAVGKLWCSDCWSGRRPPVAMPCTPSQRAQLDLWCAPLVSAKGQTPCHALAAQPARAL
jgi:hypothetical protein